ncbi:MAG: rhomboid family intramembrane serine protease [Pirellulales bacterium]
MSIPDFRSFEALSRPSRPIGASPQIVPEYVDEESLEDEPLELTADMLAPAPRRKRYDFERDMSRLPPLTIFIAAVLVLAFAWQLAVGALADRNAIMRAGASERNAVLRGEIWRIPASMHLHGSFNHLVGNCVGLFVMGLAVEHAFGFFFASVIYFVAGVVGALLCIAFEGGPTVGASGAIFGWWGATVVFLYRYREQIQMRDVRVAFVLLVWAGWTILTGLLSPSVSNFSHIGGFLAAQLSRPFYRLDCTNCMRRKSAQAQRSRFADDSSPAAGDGFLKSPFPVRRAVPADRCPCRGRR